MDANQIAEIMGASRMSIFGIRSLHDDEAVAVGQTMDDSYVWDDDVRTDESIGGTCCFEIREDGDTSEAIALAAAYSFSGRYALLGGQYSGNNDLIAEPYAIAIRDAVVLATWEA